MSIAARLKRLEQAAGIGQRCLSCRVHYIRFGDEIRRTAPTDLFVTTCATCKQTLKEIHSGYTERERAVLVAISADHTDSVKRLASNLWMLYLPRFQEIKEIGEAEERRLRELVHSANLTLRQLARKRLKVLDEYAAHQQIRLEAAVKSEQRTEQEESVYAPVLAAREEVRERRDEIIDYNLFCYYVMAEMEVFMWGEKSKETLQIIAARQRQLAEEEGCKVLQSFERL
ncbi:MAG: hypothetical protein ACJ74W_24550 [Pyrinomonadaceae bacterium]